MLWEDSCSGYCGSGAGCDRPLTQVNGWRRCSRRLPHGRQCRTFTLQPVCTQKSTPGGSRAAPQHQAARPVSDVIVPAVAGFGHKRPWFRGVPLAAGPGEGTSVCFLDEDLWEEPEDPVRFSRNLKNVPDWTQISIPDLQEPPSDP